jgi:hydroxylamine dehydrogenase
MTLETKRLVIGGLGALFLVSLVLVQWMETARRAEEVGLRRASVTLPASSAECVDCHAQTNPGIAQQWEASTHAERGVGCAECHAASQGDADAFSHYGEQIATIVTPLDCARCHVTEAEEFAASHHSSAGNILASLDNFLAETVEGSRVPFRPHSPTPGRAVDMVNGLASAFSGCQQCHGSKVALESTDGGMITVDELAPDAFGQPSNLDAVGSVARDEDGRPRLHPGTWPNTGIGRLNLDGSRGSCTACHSRHDTARASARELRQVSSWPGPFRRKRSTKSRSMAWRIATCATI